jgi:hypothetical protein
VRAIVAILQAERIGAGQHLLFEIDRTQAAARLREIEQDACAQRRIRHRDAAGVHPRQQRAIDEQRGHERFRFDRRAAGTDPPAPLRRASRSDRRRPESLRARRSAFRRCRRPLICDAAKRTSPPIADEMRHAFERHLQTNFADDVRDVALEQAGLHFRRVPPQVELLPHPDGANGVDARSGSAGRDATASGPCCRRRPPPRASTRS